MIEPKSYKWFLDFLSPDEGHMHGIETILFAKQTKFQRMEIIETHSYGRCLVLDGKMQSSQADEFIYHEALVHPAMLSHPEPKRVFVVGGGEGATVREILRHKSVEKVLMVDIDEDVVEGSKQYLPEWSQGAFDDPRVELRYMDARKYLEETKDNWDVIIIDISEPVEEGPAYLLYTKEFYKIVQNRLGKNGLITLQAGSAAHTSLLCFSAVYQTLKAVFPMVAAYQASIPSFGMPWGFTTASSKIDPRQIAPEEIDRRIKERIKGELKYYNGELHQGHFNFPKHIRAGLEKQDRIIEDNQPLFTYH
jgi:spermidine synthase